ncbi:MAG: DUF4126 domain-containing protein [Pseudomonadota bacterium]
MEQLAEISGILALTLGAAWASGINLYAAALVLGLMHSTGYVTLPPDLQLLASPMVIAGAALMYFIEFIADKIPGVDSLWDALHTFIRIPAGALLAAGAAGEMDPGLQLAAGTLGGGLAALSHATKAGGRMLINTSPEPVTNWLASFGEDVVVVLGLWTALTHPLVFIILLALMIGAMLWLLPRIWRGIKLIFKKLAGLLRPAKPAPPSNPDNQGAPP